MKIFKNIFSKLQKKSMADYTWEIVYGKIKNYKENRIGKIIHLIAAHTASVEFFSQDEQRYEALQNPNQFQRINDFHELIIEELETTGNAIVYPIIKDRQILQVWHLPNCTLEKNDQGYPVAVKYAGKRYVYNDIIHIRHNSISDMFWGEPIWKKDANLVDLDGRLKSFLNYYMENGGMPEIIMTLKNISEEEMERFEEKWMVKHTGLKKINRPAILRGEGLEIIPTGYSLKDNMIIPLANWVRKELLEAYGIPEAYFDRTANRSVAEQAEIVFQKECIIPRLEKLKQMWNEIFRRANIDTTINYYNVIPKDREYELRANEVYLRNGVKTINEVRAEEGLPEVEWGNRPLMPMGLISLSEKENLQKKTIEEKIEKQKQQNYWYEHIKLHRKNEKEIKGIVKNIFEEEKNYVLQNLEKSYKTIDYLQKDIYDDILEGIENIWIKELKKVGAKIMLQWGEKQLEELAIEIALEILQQNLEETYDIILKKGLRDIVNTTKEDIKEIIINAKNEGWGIEKIMDAITEKYEDYISGARAATIARTETTKMANAAKQITNLQVQEEKDVQVVKIWVSALDERTRTLENSDYDHWNANGEEVAAEEYFQNTGEELMYPGDPEGSPGNIINCRCTMRSIIKT